VLPGISPCGRTNVRIKGWMGRADQTAKVKGMFVHPSQVAEVVKRHPQVAKARLVVDNETGQDRMTLRCEVGRRAGRPRRGARRQHPRCHQAARRSRAAARANCPTTAR
jgi:phenylacetate-CoA ligase